MSPFKALWLRLREYPVRHYRRIEGWLTSAEAAGLYRLSRSLPAGARIVEIGSWKGKSTYCLAKGLRDGVVVAIDPFDGAGEEGNIYDRFKGGPPLIEQFRANLAHDNAIDKVEIRAGRSREFAGKVGPIDFLFIDGDHSIEGCRYDFETFAPAVKPAGLVAFHDYNRKRPELGPTWVVEKLVRPAREWEAVGKWDTLVAFRRRLLNGAIG
jgi:predicted O-methyltransferase YrrM